MGNYNATQENTFEEIGRSKESSLLGAAERGNLEMVYVCIKDETVNLDCVNEIKWTPLHLAIFNNHVDIADALIEAGANVNAHSQSGLTPLHLAVKYGHYNLVVKLIENYADCEATVVSPQINKIYDYGTPLDYAIRYQTVKTEKIVNLLTSPEAIAELRLRYDDQEQEIIHQITYERLKLYILAHLQDLCNIDNLLSLQRENSLKCEAPRLQNRSRYNCILQ